MMEAGNYGYIFSQKPFLNKDSNAKPVELVCLWIQKTFYLLLIKLLKVKENLQKSTFCGMLHWKLGTRKWDCKRPSTSPCAVKLRVRTLQLLALVWLSGDLDLQVSPSPMWLSPGLLELLQTTGRLGGQVGYTVLWPTKVLVWNLWNNLIETVMHLQLVLIFF